MQSGEIRIASIHHIKSARFQRNHIQNVDLVKCAFGDMNEGGDVPLQIQQGVQLDGAFCSSESCLGKHGQAQIDGGRIQGVHRLVQVENSRFVHIQLSGNIDQVIGIVGVHAPIATLVCFGQRASGH